MLRGLLAGPLSLLAAACSSSVQPKLAPCTAASGGQVRLAVAGNTTIDPTLTAGCAVFGPNASGSAYEYLLVPQAVSGVPDDSSAFLLRGATLPAAAAPFAAARGRPAPSIPVPQQFDLTLRRAGGGAAGPAGGPHRPPTAGPPHAAAPPLGGRRRVQVVRDAGRSA